MVRFYEKDGAGFVEFNDNGSKVNVLSGANLDNLSRILDQIEHKKDSIDALLFISPKKDIFIAGADINELAAIRTKAGALDLCIKGQDICNKIERVGVPTSAVINGACIGGGLELALSCDYILATTNKKVRIGFPEIKLGISPGFGGVHRLEERIGKKKAAHLIETGKLLNARLARQAGIVDKVIRESDAQDFQRLKGLVRQRRRLTAGPRTEIDRQERETLAEKIVTESARNALSAFLLAGKYKDRLLPKGDLGHNLTDCAIIGAGTMGRDIAYLVSSEAGVSVSISDVSKISLKKARFRISRIYKEAVKRNVLYKKEAREGFKNISFGSDCLADVDIAIECITEDRETKRRLFASIEKDVSKDCIIATNTSCLSIEELAESLERPERFIGTHFFNPAYKMKLVEVVPGRLTDKPTMDKTLAFLKRIKRVPVIVKDSPGFLVNRMLLPYLNEAVFMLEEGFSRKDIESSMIDFGMSTGPLELLEKIGLGTAYKAAKILEDRSGYRLRVSDLLRTSASKRYLTSARGRMRAEHHHRIVERLLSPMKREAEMCLEEGVADSRETIDLVLLSGAGFPASKRIWKT